MVPMLVRAHLASGIALDAQWGTALDGLLASAIWAARKAMLHERGIPTAPLADNPEPADMPLPLARCVSSDGAWHWAATCALPEQLAADDTEVRYWTGHLDQRHAEQVAATMPRQLYTHQGRWRSHHMPLVITMCRSVTWQAVGDPAAVRALLEPLMAIGKKRAQGEGMVLRWEVITPWTVSPWDAAHLHADGTLGRPTPDACVREAHSWLVTGGRGRAGLRPPYQHPARQHEMHLPAALPTTADAALG
ncbi:hypothetical protein BIV57_02090 [Mangrovactinospora gilvigrisea]|uniref:CRISPR-associated protein n=2 Tax=Mangrovactinospora gilvigrisea TaxID=1428644 RepID=A0A1J7CHP6_9ACTN|nr:hypothetical protein BIV57_02090 [Mangrovactinospora gilvigrisea]